MPSVVSFSIHIRSWDLANLFHDIGKDADLIIDFGMDLTPLCPFLNIAIGKPVIALAHRLGRAARGRRFRGDGGSDTWHICFVPCPEGWNRSRSPPTSRTTARSPHLRSQESLSRTIRSISVVHHTKSCICPGIRPDRSGCLTKRRASFSAATRFMTAHWSTICPDATNLPIGRPCAGYSISMFPLPMAATARRCRANACA